MVSGPNLEHLQQYLRQLQEVYGNDVFVQSGTAELIAGVMAGSPEVSIQETPTAEDKPAPPAIPNLIGGVLTDWHTTDSLRVLLARISGCTRCALGTTRQGFVFGSGNPNADLMVIGEAPGAEEDQQGLPFVGRAGQLLTKILESVNFVRDDVYICNILKCRPPNNRKPLAGETNQCEPYLHKQIEIVKPRFILALGLTAASTLLKSATSLNDLRGTVHRYQGIPTLVTYHPAALLRNPQWKRSTWEDMQHLRRLYDQTDNNR